MTSEEDYSNESDSESGSDSEQEFVEATGRKAMIQAHAKDRKFFDSKIKTENTESSSTFRNKQRVLLLSSRGITQRFRHLLKDLEVLLPHCRKDSKFDAKGKIGELNEVAELANCNNAIYFEVRKKQDLYMWLAKTPHGPSVCCLVQNVHTMDELKMTGNALKGSRPLLSFDKSFDSEPHWLLMKEMFIHTFGTPKGHRKSKPFYDHIFSFTIIDNRIWFRNYQIVEEDSKGTPLATPSIKIPKHTDQVPMSLVEIGPRFVLNPIRILDGSFGGPVLYENPHFISPNHIRSMRKEADGNKYFDRVRSEKKRDLKMEESLPERTEMDGVDEIFK